MIRTKATIPIAMPTQAPVIDFLPLDEVTGVREGREVGSVEAGGHVGLEVANVDDWDAVVSEREAVVDVWETGDVGVPEFEEEIFGRAGESVPELGSGGESDLDSGIDGIGGSISVGDGELAVGLGVSVGVGLLVCSGGVGEEEGTRWMIVVGGGVVGCSFTGGSGALDGVRLVELAGTGGVELIS